MNRKDTIVRALIALSGVIFVLSSLTREWKLTLIAVVPLVFAMAYGIVGKSADVSEQKLKELLEKDQETDEPKKTPKKAL
jgi:cadmium resistance protein CadD (predicted permease)